MQLHATATPRFDSGGVLADNTNTTMTRHAFTTDRGANVTVTADNGTLLVSVEADDITIDQTTARIGTLKQQPVLHLGEHRVQGTREKIHIPITEHKHDLEQLRENSEPEPTDEPLTYEVVESTRTGGWGQEITTQRLRPTKPFSERTDKQRELHWKIHERHDVPNGVEAGDIIPIEDLLDDTRTREEKNQDAIEEAGETGDVVVINKTTTPCNDSGKECDIDHVTRIAHPDGTIETKRRHTY